MNKALALMYLKRYDDAIAIYTDVIGAEPANQDALAERGVAYHYTGNLVKACEDWNKAVAAGSDKARQYFSKFCQ